MNTPSLVVVTDTQVYYYRFSLSQYYYSNTVESPDKGHFGSINSAHFVPCRGIVLFRRFYLYYFGTGINFVGLQVCL